MLLNGLNKLFLVFIFSFFTFCLPLTAAEVIPYFNASFLGGQYFFEGREGSLSGNANLLTSVSIRLSPDFILIPLYNGKYQGTKQVTDLVGGGTLFQERMDHRVAVRGVYSVSPKFRIKPELGFKWQLLKETRDEKWGKGLFDYQRPGFSLEGEYLYKDPFSVRVTYDFYYIRFLNYTSLESRIGESDGSLARELAGADVLNSSNHGLSVSANREFPWKSVAEASLGFTYRSFSDQHIVDPSGLLESGTRKDMVGIFNFGWRLPRKTSGGIKLTPGMGFAFVMNRSNQNSYDAQLTTYLDKYYDYNKLNLGASLSAQVEPSNWGMSVGFGWTRTNYAKRPIQDSSGLYQSDKIYLNEFTVGGSVSYPIAPNFRWTASAQYGKQTSNMDYEKLYKYNFDVVTYLLGFSYEY